MPEKKRNPYLKKMIYGAPIVAVQQLAQLPKGAVEHAVENRILGLPVHAGAALRSGAGKALGGTAVGILTAPLFVAGIGNLQSKDPDQRAIGAAQVIGAGSAYTVGKAVGQFSGGGTPALQVLRRTGSRLAVNLPASLGMAFGIGKGSKEKKGPLVTALYGGIGGLVGGAAKGVAEVAFENAGSIGGASARAIGLKALARAGGLGASGLLGGAVLGGAFSALSKKMEMKKEGAERTRRMCMRPTCSKPATKKSLWAEGKAAIVTCDEHVGWAKEYLAKENNTVDAVQDYDPDKEKQASAAGGLGGAATSPVIASKVRKMLPFAKGAEQAPVRHVLVTGPPGEEKTSAANDATRNGKCLRLAMADVRAHPQRKLMVGPPGQPGDTAHFWTEEDGRVFDRSGAVSAGYRYRGRAVDPTRVLMELKEARTKTAAAKHVVVTGHSGSGKTTHAQRVAKERGLPVYHIDMHPKYLAAWDAFAEERKRTGAITSPAYQAAVREAAKEVLRKRKPHVVEGTAFLHNADLADPHEMILVTAPKRKILAKRLARSKDRARLEGEAWTKEERERNRMKGLAIFEVYREAVNQLRRDKRVSVYRNTYSDPIVPEDPWVRRKKREKTAAVKDPYSSPFPHQARFAQQLDENDGVIVAAWGTGLGKSVATVFGIEYLKSRDKAKRTLVVVPTGLRKNFADTVRKASDATVQVIGNQEESREEGGGYVYLDSARGDADYTVVGYEMFRRDPVGLMQQTGADTLVLDEMHKVRSESSANYKAAKEARRHARNFIGLTASITNNDPNDMAPLLDVAMNDGFLTKKQFDRLYKRTVGTVAGFFGGEKRQYTLVNLRDLQQRIGPVISYMDTTDMRKEDLPQRDVQTVNVEMSAHQKKLYEWAMDRVGPTTAWKIRNNLPVDQREAAHIFGMIQTARQASNSVASLDKNYDLARSAEETPKVRKLLDDLESHLQTTPDGKALIYTGLVRGGVDVLHAGLLARGIDHGVFVGKGNRVGDQKVDEKSRVADVEAYRAGQKRVLILSPAGEEGLDLPDTTAFFALDGHFNPERILQAEARGIRLRGQSHRPPEERRVLVRRYRSVLPKPGFFARVFGGSTKDYSTDEWIYSTAQQKHNLNRVLKDAVKAVSFAGQGEPPKIEIPRVTPSTSRAASPPPVTATRTTGTKPATMTPVKSRSPYLAGGGGGHWRRLPPGHQGHGPDDSPVMGRTWVSPSAV